MQSTQKGMNLITALVILAVLVAGGYGIYWFAQDKNMTDETPSVTPEESERVAVSAKTDAEQTLRDVSISISNRTEADVDFADIVSELRDLSQRLEIAIETVDEDARRELSELRDRVNVLTTSVEEEADDIADVIDELIEDIEEDLADEMADEMGDDMSEGDDTATSTDDGAGDDADEDTDGDTATTSVETKTTVSTEIQ